ncbi:hypothetical protein XI08_15055 [Bradyrhizobium sp. CCBAU 11361]|nr:hypothetical protein [Bradyrhizobium sp. CCBAU 11361]
MVSPGEEQADASPTMALEVKKEAAAGPLQQRLKSREVSRRARSASGSDAIWNDKRQRVGQTRVAAIDRLIGRADELDY